MARVWSDETRLADWLAVELAVVDAWARVGAISTSSAQGIRQRAKSPTQARVADLERTTNHDVAAFVDAVMSDLGAEGRWFHYGLTSSDVLDTALALTIRRAGALVREGIARAADAVVGRAEEHRDTLTIGRTHGVHAEPTTFGLKLAGLGLPTRPRPSARRARRSRGFASGRSRARSARTRRRPPTSNASRARRSGSSRLRPRRRSCSGTATPSCSAALAILASSLDRFALEIRHLARTEVREVEEPFGRGQKGSSAMPHKRNPIVAERICGLARARPRLRGRRPGERRALARARHLALVRRTRGRSRTPSWRSTTCSTGSLGSSRASSCGRSGCARTWRRPAGSSSASGCSWRSCSPGSRETRRIAPCSATRCGPGTRAWTFAALFGRIRRSRPASSLPRSST